MHQSLLTNYLKSAIDERIYFQTVAAPFYFDIAIIYVEIKDFTPYFFFAKRTQNPVSVYIYPICPHSPIIIIIDFYSCTMSSRIYF